MKPSITRELITDRRQPTLRWSAVFAGVAVAVAFWSLLQMLGMGVGLATVDIDNAGSLRHVSIGNGVWSMLAPLFALAIGGYVAGKLATTYDQRVGATHGLIVGAIAAVVGLAITVSLVSMLAGGPVSTTTSRLLTTDHILITPSLRAYERAQAAKDAGTILLGGGVALLLGISAAVVGGGLAARRFVRGKHDTAEVPVVPPPAAPPADAPHVTTEL